MGCDSYANGNEIACKKGAGKVTAAFPDVCMSPPSPPAGPDPDPIPGLVVRQGHEEGIQDRQDQKEADHAQG